MHMSILIRKSTLSCIASISLIIKLKVKYFYEYMTSWEYFYFEHVSLLIIHTCSRYHSEAFNCGKTINTYTYYTMATPYYI